jgi:dihydroflavonol-4-reductase
MAEQVKSDLRIPEKMKVLVTGANGFLGANVVMQLQKECYDVRAMMRRGSNRKALECFTGEIFEGNMTSFTDLDQAISGCDYVIHCAAKTSQVPTRLRAYAAANISSTAFLVCLCKKHEIKRFVYVSTANCFSNGTMDDPGNENSGFMPWLRRSGYAFSKYIAQTLVLEEATYNDLPAVVVAPTYMIGPRDARPSSGRLLLYACKRRILFYPPGGKSFVDAEHAATAVVNALHKGCTGKTYLIAGENLTFKEFFKVVAGVCNKRRIMIRIPRFILASVAILSGMIGLIFRLSLPLNRVNQRLLCLDNYFSNSRAREELDLEPTRIDIAVHKAIQWFSRNGYL